MDSHCPASLLIHFSFWLQATSAIQFFYMPMHIIQRQSDETTEAFWLVWHLKVSLFMCLECWPIQNAKVSKILNNDKQGSKVNFHPPATGCWDSKIHLRLSLFHKPNWFLERKQPQNNSWLQLAKLKWHIYLVAGVIPTLYTSSLRTTYYMKPS